MRVGSADVDEGVEVARVLFRAYANLAGLLGDALEAEVGIPLPWYAVLEGLAGTPGGYLKMSQLCQVLSMTSGGVTRIVDRVEAAGYVQRVAHPSDRRVSHLTITDMGREVLGKADRVFRHNVDAHLVGRLESLELRELNRIICKLRHD
jgi:DNA-binding MarR family transcriptional regulator